ncbi:ABC transporter ATP-binding protein [Corynebacterium timonense]|uniref:ABC-2 type transport system ATP-binding protein n=1 Tax=Corynebacterium timonense TaxID=441500 RepID=A0A1H1S7S0_9CORY|nr:ABC transporter ATP-binding protein [Corynebacterium timonense]SDS44002.1 ABC-2 type transport system ATP-binding protein [Corynebacterium timonense]
MTPDHSPDHSPGFYGLVGPNAAGKTHYLRSLFGPGAALVPAAADALFVGRTVRDHLAWAAEAKPLDEISLDISESSHLNSLSVGQRRELTFAVALAANEPILLLDEPFDGLDINTRIRLRARLIDYIAADPGRTVIMASHRAEDLAGLAEHVIQVFGREVSDPVALDEARTRFPVLSGDGGDPGQLLAGLDVVSVSTLGPAWRAQLAQPLDRDVPGATVDYPDDAALIDLLASRKA